MRPANPWLRTVERTRAHPHTGDRFRFTLCNGAFIRPPKITMPGEPQSIGIVDSAGESQRS
jgi:hypothetical protein